MSHLKVSCDNEITRQTGREICVGSGDADGILLCKQVGMLSTFRTKVDVETKIELEKAQHADLI